MSKKTYCYKIYLHKYILKQILANISFGHFWYFEIYLKIDLNIYSISFCCILYLNPSELCSTQNDVIADQIMFSVILAQCHIHVELRAKASNRNDG